MEKLNMSNITNTTNNINSYEWNWERLNSFNHFLRKKGLTLIDVEFNNARFSISGHENDENLNQLVSEFLRGQK